MSGSKTLLSYADLETRDSLEAFTEQRIMQGNTPARAITFLADEDPTHVFSQSVNPSYRTEIEDKGEFSAINLTRRIKGKQYAEGHRSIRGKFYLISHEEDEVYSAFTFDSKDFFHLGVERFIQSQPISLSTSYLSTDELRRLFDHLDRRADGSVIITKAVVKSPSEKTEITYRDSKHHEVFNEAQDDDYFVDKIQFEIRSGRHEFQGYIARGGQTRYIEGDGRIFFNYLVGGAASLLSEKGSLFKDRSREFGTREADPIRIEYEEDSIVGVEENMRLIRTLDGISNSSLTVFHKNPYLHASLMDFDDGSSLDVFLTSESEVAIVPGFKASRHTLSRVCEQIIEGFREGEVVANSARKEKTIEDYAG